ncbi:hypothetical protein [Rhizobium mongolense]|uniref:hypothetical protein n=1 Tax=Rhizobium mongolense TaxID=57676 RepID=UPI0034A22A91
MKRLRITFVVELIKLAAIVALVASPVSVAGPVSAADHHQHGAVASDTSAHSHQSDDCAVSEDGETEHHDKYGHGRNCCSTVCSVFAILLDKPAMHGPQFLEFRFVPTWSELNSVDPETLQRPPNAKFVRPRSDAALNSRAEQSDRALHERREDETTITSGRSAPNTGNP